MAKAKNKKSNKASADVLNNADIADGAGNPYKVGDIVLAVAGRDEDRFFVVVGILNRDYVLIADGRSRRADAPKKKKVRHIKLTGEAAGFNLKDGRFTNAVLRNIITEYVKNIQPEVNS